MQYLLSKAVMAVECENSLWKARQMPAYGARLRPMARLGGELGLPGNAVLPTVIMKEEDRGPLRRWQDQAQVPIHIWHVFYDLAFGLALNTAEAQEEPTLIADCVVDKNGHILPYVRFDGGRLAIVHEALDMLDEIARARNNE